MTVIGRLAAAPELSATATGNDIIKYSVACGYGPKDNRQTSWFKVGCFDQEGPRRDILLGMQKGTLVYVEGDARMNTYEDKEGVTRSSLAITQRHIEVLKRPEQAEGSNATS
ncbi:MAG: ssDNA-binding protein, mitochondrial [Piccolia ochrophora]|nr:MAG: ssDNA-binding protein, mitochondrial [Piccolia ochrophora]